MPAHLATSTDRLGRNSVEHQLAAFPEAAARGDARALGRYLRAAGVLVAGQCVLTASQLSPSCWRVVASRTGDGPARVVIEDARPRVYVRASEAQVSL